MIGKDSREVLAAFGRLELASGAEISEERQAGIATTLRERYTDAQIVQAIDVLRFTWKPTYGHGLAVCDLVDVIEGGSSLGGKLLTYDQMLREYDKTVGGGQPADTHPTRPTITDLYELVEMDGGPKWRKR